MLISNAATFGALEIFSATVTYSSNVLPATFAIIGKIVLF